MRLLEKILTQIISLTFYHKPLFLIYLIFCHFFNFVNFMQKFNVNFIDYSNSIEYFSLLINHYYFIHFMVVRLQNFNFLLNP